jgi:hypothetical protein
MILSLGCMGIPVFILPVYTDFPTKKPPFWRRRIGPGGFEPPISYSQSNFKVLSLVVIY